jgi:hypothetical protein
MILPKEVIIKVCAERHIHVAELLGTSKLELVVEARKAIAIRLAAAGHNINRIARELRKDRTTILYYLGVRDGGGIKLRSRFSKPGTRDPDRTKHRYKVPYAGADMREYVWKERGREP